MTTNFRRTFGDAASPLPLSYLDDNFNQLENTSTSTVTLAGAGLVGYIASGSGATSETVQYILRELAVMPQMFGGVGDGSTDDTNAVLSAINTGRPVLLTRTFVVDAITASNVYIFGTGGLKKKTSTKGEMLTLTGDNIIEGITLDYDWTNATQTQPYTSNNLIGQTGGSLRLRDATFTNSFAKAVNVIGGSVDVRGCIFTDGAPHNGLSGGSERVTFYIAVTADSDMAGSERVLVSGNYFEGTSLAAADLHKNPTAVIINASAADGGDRYEAVNISDNIMLGTTTNVGPNVTGAIDTYDGVKNITISGNVIRLYTYAGIKVQNSSRFAITGNTVTEGSSPTGVANEQSFAIMAAEKVRSSTAEETDGTITGNVITAAEYQAIQNSVDNVTISGNVINGVTLTVVGTGIDNTGSNVTISGNVLVDIGGVHISTATGGDVAITGNVTSALAAATAAFVTFSGADITITNNKFTNASGTAGTGVRTNGPASYIRIEGNTFDGSSIGPDCRTTGGAVSDVHIGPNTYKNVTTKVNIATSVTSVTAIVPDTVSADKGNAGATLTALVSDTTAVWNTALTTNRAVTLDTGSNLINGAKFRIVRTANATGASALNVGTGPLKALAVGEWCDVQYNGATAAWMLTGFGAL